MTATLTSADIRTGQVWRSKKNPERRIVLGVVDDSRSNPDGWDWRFRDIPAGKKAGRLGWILAYNLLKLYDLEQEPS